jgi:hypothetical protein
MVHQLSSHLHYVIYALDSRNPSHKPPLKTLAWLIEAATPSRCCWFEHGSAVSGIEDSSGVDVGVDIPGMRMCSIRVLAKSCSAVRASIIRWCVRLVCMSPKNACLLRMVMDSVPSDSSVSRSGVACCHAIRSVVGFASVVSITTIMDTVIEASQCAA